MPVERTVQMYKRLILDVNLYTDQLLQTSFPAFVQRLHAVSRKVSFELSGKTKYLLSAIMLNWQSRFYMPIISYLSSNDVRKVRTGIRNTAILVNLLGEIKIWFGLDTTFPDSFPSLKHSDDEKHKEASQSENALFLSAPLIGGSSRVKQLFVDLFSLILIGPDFNRFIHQVDGQAGPYKLTLGQIALSVELIFVLRRLRIASKHGLIAKEIRESIRVALYEIERKVFSFVKMMKLRGITVPEMFKILHCNLLIEAHLFSETQAKPFWFSFAYQWAIDALQSAAIETGAQSSDQIPESAGFTDLEKLYVDGQLNLGDDESGLFGKDFFRARLNYMFGHGQDKRSTDTQTVFLRDFQSASLTLLTILHQHMDISDMSRLMEVGWAAMFLEPEFARRKLSFLVMYCAENCQLLSKSVIYAELCHDDPEKRMGAVHRLSYLFLYRRFVTFQTIPFETPLLNSVARFATADVRPYLSAFKTPATMVPFVPPDFGSDDLAVINEPEWLMKLKEVARQIRRQESNGTQDQISRAGDMTNAGSQIHGWDLEEEARQSERRRRLETMVLLLPSTALADSVSSEGRAAKTKSIFPSTLTLFSFGVIDTTADSFGPLHILSREIISDMIRDDPNLFLRAFFSELPVASYERQMALITRLRRLLLSRKNLPSAFSHMLLNYLIGFMKWTIIETKKNKFDTVVAFVPLVAELVAAVQGMSFKDFRKGRVEALLLSLGRFWYSEAVSQGVFPKALESMPDKDFANANRKAYQFLAVPPLGMKTSLLRCSQTQLMIQFLLRYPIEVNAFRRIIRDSFPEF